jgi:pectinesterase
MTAAPGLGGLRRSSEMEKRAAASRRVATVVSCCVLASSILACSNHAGDSPEPLQGSGGNTATGSGGRSRGGPSPSSGGSGAGGGGVGGGGGASSPGGPSGGNSGGATAATKPGTGGGSASAGSSTGGGSSPATGGANAGGANAGGSSASGGRSPGGSGGNASTSGGGTSGSSAGSSGNGAGPPPSGGARAGADPLTGLGGTATRPLLTAAQAAQFSIANCLAETGALGSLKADPWDPTAGVSLPASTSYTAGPGAKYATVQAAVDAAVAAGGSTRVYIQLASGVYPEQVCVGATAPPITLYGTDADASQTVIQHADFQGGIATMGSNACGGTDANMQAATLVVLGAGFEAKNLTVQNSVTTAQIGTNTKSQAVSLAISADRVALDNVRVLSHQDTLYLATASGTVSRVYARDSYFAGDVDFIFGGATAVFDHCTITFLSDRGKTSGYALSPSTDSRNPYGFLVVNSTFGADAATPAGGVSLGRPWDQSCTDTATYVATCVPSGKYPNGQATVMQSTIGPAYSPTAPWAAAATTKRGYSSIPWACVAGGTCPANRLYEYNDTQSP